MKLKKIADLKLIPTAPFDFDKTFHKPDHFTSGDNYWEPGVRHQTFILNGKKLGVVFKNVGTLEKPCINELIHCNTKLSHEFILSFNEEVKYRYNLNFDLEPFYKKFGAHKLLGPAIKRMYGMRPGQPSSLYEYLIIGVVLQNTPVGRSIQMFKVLLEKYGTPLEFSSKRLWCFWEPGRLKGVSVDELRALKVGYRAKFIKKIDDYFSKGKINEEDLRGVNKETQKEELLKLYGVGPATVWYIMFDVFHRWDTFDHISPWEQKIYSKLFFDKDPENPVSTEKLLRFISGFAPHRHLAIHYFWEDLWWKHKNGKVGWLQGLIRA